MDTINGHKKGGEEAVIGIGSLMIEVVRDGKRPLLRILGRPHGLHSDVTKEELLRLSRYLADEAEKLPNERR